MADSRLFVGRKAELDRWGEVLAEPRGQAVIVVGHPGMGKTMLTERMASYAQEHPDFVCGWVRYEVTRTQSPGSIMEAMIEDAFQAASVAEKSSDPTSGAKARWRSLWKIVGLLGTAGTAAAGMPLPVHKGVDAAYDTIQSLKRNPRRNIRDEFIERLELISKRMPANGRAVFIIDPEKSMQPGSDEDWAIVVKRLPAKIKIVFAQRHDDALLRGEVFGGLLDEGRAVRIPPEDLDALDEQAVGELVGIRAQQMKRDEAELLDAVARYEGHPYAVPAALDLVAAGTPVEDLQVDPTPDGVVREQWKKIGQGGATGQLGDKAVAMFQAYAALEVAVPDDVVEIVAEIAPAERTSLMHDGYLRPLLRREGEARRVYHAILADFIRAEMEERVTEPYHRRAVEEFRQRLKRAEQENTAPDSLAAERLAWHVLAVEDAGSFANCFIAECGQPLIRLGRFEAFEALTSAALDRVHNEETTAQLYGNLGLIYRTRGDLAGAEDLYRKSLEIEEKLGNQEGMAADYGNLGLIYRTRGDLDGAEELHRKALEIEEKLGRQEGMANRYAALGLVHDARGNLEEAEAWHRKGLEIEEQLGRREGMARQYGNLGVIYKRRGDLDGGEEMLRKSLAINEELGRLEGMANRYGSLGVIYETRGDVAEARRLWGKARGLYEKIGMPHMVGKVQGLIDRLGNGA
jgi:tetratricopeptide (TPR) repeat protein